MQPRVPLFAVALVALTAGVLACDDAQRATETEEDLVAVDTTGADTADTADTTVAGDTSPDIDGGGQDTRTDADAEPADTSDVDTAQPPPPEGVLGSSVVVGHSDPVTTTVAAFPDAGGGALVALEIYETLTVPVGDDEVLIEASLEDRHTVLLWVAPDASITRVESISNGRADAQLFTLSSGIAVTVWSPQDADLLLDGQPVDAPTLDRTVIYRATSDGTLTVAGSLAANTAHQNTRLSTVAEDANGQLVVAGRAGDLTLTLAGFPPVTLAPPDSDEWGGHAWFATAPGDTVRVTAFGGTAGQHINAVLPLADGGHWICGDVGGFGDDMTVVLDPGGATETTLTAVSADDDPSFDLFVAHLDAGGQVVGAWLQYAYNNNLGRGCAMAEVDGDLLLNTHTRPPYTDAPPPVTLDAWTEPDGDVVTIEVFDATYDIAWLARISPDGDLRWWRETTGVGPLQLDGDEVRLPATLRDGDVVFYGTALEQTVAVQPNDQRGVAAHTSWNLTAGDPGAVRGGGLADFYNTRTTVLSDGSILVVAPGYDALTIGHGTDEPVVCPEVRPDGRACLVVIGPSEPDANGTLWQ